MKYLNKISATTLMLIALILVGCSPEKDSPMTSSSDVAAFKYGQVPQPILDAYNSHGALVKSYLSLTEEYEGILQKIQGVPALAAYQQNQSQDLKELIREQEDVIQS